MHATASGSYSFAGMKAKGTWRADWNDCRHNHRDRRKARLSKIQRVVRAAMMDDMAPDGGGGGRVEVEAIHINVSNRIR